MKYISINNDNWDIYDIEGDSISAINWFIKNIDTKYDWLGAITSILPFNINFSNRYFCSEACAHMLGIKNPKSQTPESLYRLLSK